MQAGIDVALTVPAEHAVEALIEEERNGKVQ
jgi:hypothetical protein